MPRPRMLDLELEAVTPLWLGGAGFKAELRAPTMRGNLRFWLRALLGGVFGDVLPNIRAAETAVYGNTQLASAVMVRLTGSPRISETVVEKKDPPLAGLGYMLWSVFGQKRDAILAGEKFRLRMHPRPLPLDPMEVAGRTLDMDQRFDLALASLWLLVRLGGVGARVRRGVGAMRALSAPEGWPAALPSLISTAATPAELTAELAAGIRQVSAFAGWSGPAPVEPSSYDLLHHNVCQMYVIDNTFGSWWEALNWVGERFQFFRVELREDASAIAALLTRGQIAARTISRAVFGLPLQFFFKSIHAALIGQGVDPREARRKASATVVPNRGLGRGSPLCFRILPLPGAPGRYGVLMILFRSRFLPDMDMTVRPNDNSIRPVRVGSPMDFKLITRWFSFLESQPVGLLAVPLPGGTL